MGGSGSSSAAETRTELRLSPAQHWLVLMSRRLPTNVFDQAHVLDLPVPVDADVLVEVAKRLLHRHTALSLRLRRRSGRYLQTVGEPAPVAHAELAPTGDDRTVVREWLDAAPEMAIAVDGGPLATLAVASIGGRAELAMRLHHVVGDWWSYGVLLRDAGEMCAAIASNRPLDLPELRIDFPTYANAMAEEAAGAGGARSVDHWHRHLNGSRVLVVHADRPRSAHSSSGTRFCEAISSETSAALRQVVRGRRGSDFMLHLAMFAVVMAAWTGERDIVVPTEMANRPTPALFDVVGCFASSVFLRVRVEPGPFSNVLLEAQRATLGAIRHQGADTSRVMRRLGPDFLGSDLTDNSASIVFQMSPPPRRETSVPERARVRTGGLAGAIPLPSDIHWVLRPESTVTRATIDYDASLFDASTIVGLWEHFANVAAAVAADESTEVGELLALRRGA